MKRAEYSRLKIRQKPDAKECVLAIHGRHALAVLWAHAGSVLSGRGRSKARVAAFRRSLCQADTALAQLAREKMHRLDDARSLIRQLFRTEVDLIPDQPNKTLTVRLHPLTAEVHDQVITTGSWCR